MPTDVLKTTSRTNTECINLNWLPITNFPKQDTWCWYKTTTFLKVALSIYLTDGWTKLWCHIHGVFFGADDIMLLSASQSGLNTLVDLCQEFASGKNLKFGTDPDLRSLRPSVLSSAKARKIGWMFQQLCWMVMHSHGSLKLSILEMFSKVTTQWVWMCCRKEENILAKLSLFSRNSTLPSQQF